MRIFRKMPPIQVISAKRAFQGKDDDHFHLLEAMTFIRDRSMETNQIKSKLSQHTTSLPPLAWLIVCRQPPKVLPVQATSSYEDGRGKTKPSNFHMRLERLNVCTRPPSIMKALFSTSENMKPR